MHLEAAEFLSLLCPERIILIIVRWTGMFISILVFKLIILVMWTGMFLNILIPMFINAEDVRCKVC